MGLLKVGHMEMCWGPTAACRAEGPKFETSKNYGCTIACLTKIQKAPIGGSVMFQNKEETKFVTLGKPLTYKRNKGGDQFLFSV